MDPETTLITFLLQTDPSVQSVHLIGSWDNFRSSYAMKQDVRRGRGQWRGCYAFKDIVCDNNASGKASRRNGGLKMGATYYYYYEVNGSTETHDPAESWTTTCPFLPGQAVNTLTVPIERTFRKRSASLSSVRKESFKTMDPDAKFTTPEPVESQALRGSSRRLVSAPLPLLQPTTPSPPFSSWKRFFSRKLLARDVDHSLSCNMTSGHSALSLPDVNARRAVTPNGGSRIRDLSPDSLRQFLQEDTKAAPDAKSEPEVPSLRISEEVSDDVDDANFATFSHPDSQQYVTSLSPPPFQRSVSSETVARIVTNSSSLTLTAARLSDQTQGENTTQKRMLKAGCDALPKIETNPDIRWSISATSSDLATPISPHSTEDEFPSLYDSNDDDDVLSSHDGEDLSPTQPLGLTFAQEPFKGYSLPRQHDQANNGQGPKAIVSGLPPPRVVGRSEYNSQINDHTLIGTNIDSGLDDLVDELGWIVDAIGVGAH